MTEQLPPPMLPQSEPVPPAKVDTYFGLEDKLKQCDVADLRVRKRVQIFMQQQGNHLGQSVPLACQDWESTAAAYRLLSNPRVDEQQILAGHFAATAERARRHSGLLLIPHDTTECVNKRNDPSRIGVLKKLRMPTTVSLEPSCYTTCGTRIHASLAHCCPN